MAGEDEAEKLPRHNAAADDGKANPFRHVTLSLDFERMREWRRVVVWLWNPARQSLRHRGEIGTAHGAESLSLSLIRSAFWTEHRVFSEALGRHRRRVERAPEYLDALGQISLDHISPDIEAEHGVQRFQSQRLVRDLISTLAFIRNQKCRTD